MIDHFYSLRYESYFSLNISNARIASFHLQCLCCHKNPILLYNSLATNVQSSGIFETVKWDLCDRLLLQLTISVILCLARTKSTVCKLPPSVSMLSPKASCVQVHFLSNTVQANGTLVTLLRSTVCSNTLLSNWRDRWKLGNS